MLAAPNHLAPAMAARKGLLASERLRTSWCYDNIASKQFSRSELKRCCRVTHKEKAKVKNAHHVKWKEEKAFHECVD